MFRYNPHCNCCAPPPPQACNSAGWGNPIHLTTGGTTYVLTFSTTGPGGAAWYSAVFQYPLTGFGSVFRPDQCQAITTTPFRFVALCDTSTPKKLVLFMFVSMNPPAAGCDGAGTHPCTWGSDSTYGSFSANTFGSTVTTLVNVPLAASGTWTNIKGVTECAGLTNPFAGVPWTLTN